MNLSSKVILTLRNQVVAPICRQLSRGTPRIDVQQLTDHVLSIVVVRARHLPDQANLEAYSRKTTRCEALKCIIREKKHQTDELLEEPLDEAPTALERCLKAEELEALRRHLAGFRPLSRRAFWAQYGAVGSVREIARAARLSDTRIRQIAGQTLKQARAKFRLEGLLDN